MSLRSPRPALFPYTTLFRSGGMSDAQSGLLFTAQFLASVASSAVAGPLGARRGYGALIAAGLLITGLGVAGCAIASPRSEEHTSELQSHVNLVCRLLLEKKK